MTHTCSPTISRRSLLRGLAAGAGIAAVGSALGPSLRVAYAATPGYTGDVLVVLSLRGGFDGMSAVAPVGDPGYHRLRPSIAVPQGSALRLDSMFGLHPSLAPLAPMAAAGTACFVHAVGLAEPNRSHFDAMAQIERAAPGSALRTGWLDRVLGLGDPGGPFGGVQVGSTRTPTALIGPYPTLAMDSLDGFDLNAVWNDESRRRWSTALTALHSRSSAAMRANVTGTMAALTTAARLSGPTNAPTVQYPGSSLGHALSDAARLIRGAVGVRAIAIDEGDWDMHAGMGGADGGWMASHLADLGAALRAFADDLGPLLSGVTLLTMTEFGRRADENMSQGLDHGWGTAMILVGGGLVPGVHGRWPGLANTQLVDGDLAVTTDYRAVLADVLANRCGATSSQVSAVLPGFGGARLGVTRPRA